MPYTVPLIINGKDVTTSTTFPVISPSSHKEIWSASSASLSRRTILLKAADLFESRAKELGDYMMEETGAEQAFSGGFNVPTTIEMLRDVAGRISTVTGTIPSCAQEGTAALIVKEPYGVVLGIAPW